MTLLGHDSRYPGKRFVVLCNCNDPLGPDFIVNYMKGGFAYFRAGLLSKYPCPKCGFYYRFIPPKEGK